MSKRAGLLGASIPSLSGANGTTQQSAGGGQLIINSNAALPAGSNDNDKQDYDESNPGTSSPIQHPTLTSPPTSPIPSASELCVL